VFGLILFPCPSLKVTPLPVLSVWAFFREPLAASFSRCLEAGPSSKFSFLSPDAIGAFARSPNYAATCSPSLLLLGHGKIPFLHASSGTRHDSLATYFTESPPLGKFLSLLRYLLPPFLERISSRIEWRRVFFLRI